MSKKSNSLVTGEFSLSEFHYKYRLSCNLREELNSKINTEEIKGTSVVPAITSWGNIQMMCTMGYDINQRLREEHNFFTITQFHLLSPRQANSLTPCGYSSALAFMVVK